MQYTQMIHHIFRIKSRQKCIAKVSSRELKLHILQMSQRDNYRTFTRITRTLSRPA